jgi:amino acid transporter
VNPPSQDSGETNEKEDLERYGRYRIQRQRPPLRPDLELHEVRRGLKPGSRYVRIIPRVEPLRRVGPAYIQATDAVLRPQTVPGQVGAALRRFLIGSPLASSQAIRERLGKAKALAVFASDNLSSSAYATEEILLVLILAGTGALTASLPIAGAIGALVLIVAFSYRQTVRAYPSGGGAYTVARENLGRTPGLVAASALMVGYVLTVAVSIAAGVAAVTSAVPELHEHRAILSLVFVWLIVLGNLRGIRESGTIFSIPAYLFIVSFGAMLVTGFVRSAQGVEAEPLPPETVAIGTSSLGLFLILRAFSSGCAALTGIEATANGVPAFKPPESRNAAITLTWMALILATFFIGLTVLAHRLDIIPVEQPTVVSQVAKTAFGGTPPYYIVQVATALILLLAANTSFAGFPQLASAMARDGFLPRQFTFRGDRLAFSTGIIALGVLASGLLLIYQAETHRLIPLYALGVFVSLTLSQSGMVRHWLSLRGPGWRGSMAVNGVGAVATAVVAVVVGSTRFVEGAWIVVVAIPILVLILGRIHDHYQRVGEQLAISKADLQPALRRRGDHRAQTVIVPVDELNRAVLQTVEHARTLSDDVAAVHVTDDPAEAEALRAQWEERVPDVPIVILESPYRALIAPFLAYVDALDRANPDARITVVLPEFVPAQPWQRFLHNQPAVRLRRALQARPNTVVVSVPYHLR